MVGNIHKYKNKIIQKVVSSYERLHDRLSIIRSSEKAMKNGFFGLFKIREIAKRLKEVIAFRFRVSFKCFQCNNSTYLQETLWLNETDELSLNRLTQFLITLDEMQLGIEFDEKDNLQKWRGYNKYIAMRYFDHSKRLSDDQFKTIICSLFRSIGCARFDVIHPFVTIFEELENDIETNEVCI